jgi:Ca2+-binding RTX toxin-like protein
LKKQDLDMSRRSWKQWFLQQFGLAKRSTKPRRAPHGLTFETLDPRITPTVNAFFGAGVLTVIGDNANNTIDVSRDAGGKLLVNGGAVSIRGAISTASNTRLIQVFGLSGNDTISLNEANGALPRANLYGGNGNDTLTGGSGNDLLFGESGNDTLLGKGGLDFLFGGAGDDIVTGGTGNDQVFGQAGNDRMIWNPGDGTDLNEGGAGTDTVEVNGGNGAETFAVTPNGVRVRFDRTDPAPFSIDIGTTENLFVNMNGGDDTFVGSNGLAGLISLAMDGGAGNDTITGGDGADSFSGGDGNDALIGGRGNDLLFGGAGDDTFIWNPGDGSDTIEGGDGTDIMLFNGANLSEDFDVSANGARVRFTRDIGSVVMDLNDVERIDLNALGGADNINVGNLTDTDLAQFNIDLAATINGTVGDAQNDTVTVNGTNGADQIQVLGNGTSGYVVTGLTALVSVKNSEGANDRLALSAEGGDDTVNASTLVAGIVKLSEDGGAGNDTIVGSRGDDLLFRGNDVMIGDAGNDTFEWDPGDGSDTIEGGDGSDTMIFNGANIDEKIDIAANGNRVRFSRDFANITMDLNGVEVIDFNAFGGADTITVNDLSATDVSVVNLDLSSAAGIGIGDAASDSVIVNGTAGDDALQIASFDNGTRIAIGGLFPFVNIIGAEATNDHLTIKTLGGNDAVDASSLPVGSIQLTLDGGDGNDDLSGGSGNDTLIGGAGDDVLRGGPGVDLLDGGSGDNTLIQD